MKIRPLLTAAFAFAAAISYAAPTAQLTWELEPGFENTSLHYNIAVDLDGSEATVESYRVWIDAPGNVTKDEKDTATGTLTAPAGENYWIKAIVTLSDDSTIIPTGNDTGVYFTKKEVTFPTLTMACEEPVATSATTGTVAYTVTLTSLEGVKAVRIFAVTVGEKLLGTVDVDPALELKGTLDLSDLNESAHTPIWIKAQAVMENDATGGTVETGSGINTSAFESTYKPVLNVTWSTAEATSATTATISYDITGERLENVESYHIWININYGEGDLVAADITTTETNGTLDISNLLADTNTQLWLKVVPNLKNGQTGDLVLSNTWVTTPNEGTQTGIEAVEATDATAIYYTLDGRPAGRIEPGTCYIMVKAGKSRVVRVL